MTPLPPPMVNQQTHQLHEERSTPTTQHYGQGNDSERHGAQAGRMPPVQWLLLGLCRGSQDNPTALVKRALSAINMQEPCDITGAPHSCPVPRKQALWGMREAAQGGPYHLLGRKSSSEDTVTKTDRDVKSDRTGSGPGP